MSRLAAQRLRQAAADADEVVTGTAQFLSVTDGPLHPSFAFPPLRLPFPNTVPMLAMGDKEVREKMRPYERQLDVLIE